MCVCVCVFELINPSLRYTHCRYIVHTYHTLPFATVLRITTSNIKYTLHTYMLRYLLNFRNTVERQKVMNHLNWPRGRCFWHKHAKICLHDGTPAKNFKDEKKQRKKTIMTTIRMYWMIGCQHQSIIYTFFQALTWLWFSQSKERRKEIGKKSFNVNLNDDQKRNILFFYSSEMDFGAATRKRISNTGLLCYLY